MSLFRWLRSGHMILYLLGVMMTFRMRRVLRMILRGCICVGLACLRLTRACRRLITDGFVCRLCRFSLRYGLLRLNRLLASLLVELRMLTDLL